ncbi:MAG: ABC transporter substrate binding protein [Pseudomonadota bacterium]
MADASPLRVMLLQEGDLPGMRSLESMLGQRLRTESGVLLLSSSSRPEQADLLVAIGKQAAASVAGTVRPVLNIQLAADVPQLRSTKRSAFLYIEQPAARQLALIRAALPQVRTVGILLSEPRADIARLRRQFIDAGIAVEVEQVEDDAELAPRLQSLLRRSDVLLAAPQAGIYRSDTIRNILLETYRQRVPMIGLSPNFVRAGALCAVYSTPEQIAEQAAAIIGDYARTRRLPADQYPLRFEVAVNFQVAHSLGIPMKGAEQLQHQMRRGSEEVRH